MSWKEVQKRVHKLCNSAKRRGISIDVNFVCAKAKGLYETIDGVGLCIVCGRRAKGDVVLGEDWELGWGLPIFENGSVERVLLGERLLLLKRRAAARFFSEVMRVLKPGGVIDVRVPDLSYVAFTLATKYHDSQATAIALLLGRAKDTPRGFAYNYPVLAEILQKVGFTRIEKRVCPIRKLRGKRENLRTPLDAVGDFPSPLMTVVARKPKSDSEPAFFTVDELPSCILERSLKNHDRRVKAVQRYGKQGDKHGKKEKEGKVKKKSEKKKTGRRSESG